MVGYGILREELRATKRGEQMNQQPTFADLDYQHKRKRVRRDEFLERMDSLVPWQRLEERIRPHYFRAQRGRRPYPLSVMLQVHIVQLSHNLNAPAMEDLLYQAESVRRFAGLRLSEPIPDESTILHFRHLLEGHELGQGLFEEIKGHLEEQGMRLREGTIWTCGDRWSSRTRGAGLCVSPLTGPLVGCRFGSARLCVLINRRRPPECSRTTTHATVRRNCGSETRLALGRFSGSKDKVRWHVMVIPSPDEPSHRDWTFPVAGRGRRRNLLFRTCPNFQLQDISSRICL